MLTDPSDTRLDSEVVDDAIAIIRTNGWCKGAFRNGAGQHCLAGALAESLKLQMTPIYVGDPHSIPYGTLAETRWRDLTERLRKIIVTMRETNENSLWKWGIYLLNDSLSSEDEAVAYLEKLRGYLQERGR